MPLLKPEEAASLTQEEAKAAALYEEREAEQLFKLRQEERGGMIRRQPYTTTGKGALAGMVVGGALGAIGTGKLGVPVPAALALATTGAIVGEGIEQGVYALTSRDPADAITLEESATGFGEQVGAAVTGEAVGAVALTFLKPLRYVQARPLRPEQVVRKATLGEYNIPTLAPELTDSGIHKFLADVGEFGVFSPPSVAEKREVQIESQKLASRAVTDAIGAKIHKSDLGIAVANYVKEEQKVANATADTMYNGVREKLQFTTREVSTPTGQQVPRPSGLAGPTGVPLQVPEMEIQTVTEGGLLADISNTATVFKKELDGLAVTAKTNPDVAAVLAKDPFYKTAETYAVGKEPLQWNVAHDFLQSVRRRIRSIQDSPLAQTEPAEIGSLYKIEATLEGDLQKALTQSANPEHQPLLAQWQAAQGFVKERSQTLRNETILNLVRTVEEHGGEPAMRQFVNTLSPDDLAKVMHAVAPRPSEIGPHYLQDSLRRAFVLHGVELAGGNTAETATMLNPKKLRDYVFGKTELTDRKADLLLTPAQQQRIGTLANAIEAQQKQMKPGAFGSMFMAMKTSGAVFTIPATAAALVVGGSVAPVSTLLGSVTILAGPRMLGEWMLKPETTKLLTEGLRYSFAHANGPKMRVLKELMSLDRNFARAVQLAVSQAGVAAQVGGPPTRTAETTELQSVTTLPTAFPMEK